VLAALGGVAALDGALIAAVVLGLLALALGLRVVNEAAGAMATALEALPEETLVEQQPAVAEASA
jgi:hypothetical protein